MALPLNVILRNATGHRHVFTVTDNVCEVAVLTNTDLDDEETIAVQLCRDDNDRGSITYGISGEIGSTKDDIEDEKIVDMD